MYKSKSFLNRVIIPFVYACAITGILVTSLVFLLALLERPDRIKWDKAKQQCLSSQPQYYCDALLGKDFLQRPSTIQ